MAEHDTLLELFKESFKRSIRDEVRLEVEEELRREAVIKAFANPDITLADVCKLLGKSKNVVQGYRRNPALNFPKPRLGAGDNPTWYLNEIQDWRANRPELPY